jgi:hypothetical protein
VLPGQSAAIDGPDPQYATVKNGIGIDGFDAWIADRDRYYRVSTSGNLVSPQMVGAADLAQYGSWTQSSEYGAVWYPNDVGPDWAPYRNGYWVDVGAYGPTWVDYAPWGYAPFHYGRWAYINGRWGWCPGRYVARPLWAPALVAWTGGAGWGVSATIGGPVYGWVPLAWGEPYRPWWGRCSYGCWDRYNRPYAVNVNAWRPNSPPPSTYRNWNAPNAVTAVRGNSFYSRQPVQQNMVRVSREQFASAPVLSSAPPVRGDASARIPTNPRPASAPPPASTFQQTYARPAQQMQGGGNTTRVPTATMQPYQSPASPGVSPTTRMPTQAVPSQPVQRDDSNRRTPTYAQPTPPAQSYAQPPSRVAQPSPQPRDVQPPPQGQMRTPQPVQAQPQMQQQQPVRVQQPQMQPQQPVRVQQPQIQPQMQPQQPVRVQQPQIQPQPMPQVREARPAPPPMQQAAPQPVPQQHAAPPSRGAPQDSGNQGQRGAPQSRDTPPGQDGGGSGRIQR